MGAEMLCFYVERLSTCHGFSTYKDSTALFSTNKRLLSAKNLKHVQRRTKQYEIRDSMTNTQLRFAVKEYLKGGISSRKIVALEESDIITLACKTMP